MLTLPVPSRMMREKAFVKPLKYPRVGRVKYFPLMSNLTNHIIIKFIRHSNTAWKVFKYGVFSDPYFFCIQSEFGLNLRIQSEYRKIRTKKNSVFGHFSRSERVPHYPAKWRPSLKSTCAFIRKNVHCALAGYKDQGK